MLLVGLGVGVLVRDRQSLIRSLLAGAVACLLWGIVVGLAASSLIVVVGGTVLAVLNLAVGAFVGWAGRSAFRAVRAKSEPSATSR
jgi:hypothetical protein